MKAWIEPANTVRDIAHANPEDIYVAEIAAMYDTEVPDGTVNGATLIDGEWVNPAEEAPPELPQQYDLEPSPIQFKLLFTFQEGIALYASADPGVKYFLRLLDDPRTTSVDLTLDANKQALAYLVSLHLLTQERADTVLLGLPL